MRYHIASAGMTTVKKANQKRHRRDLKKLELFSCVAVENGKRAAAVKNGVAVTQNVKHRVTM